MSWAWVCTARSLAHPESADLLTPSRVFASRAGIAYAKATGTCLDDEVPIGAIVGGVVGGVVGLALIIGVTVGLICFCKKKNAGSAGSTAGVQMSGAAPGGKV